MLKDSFYPWRRRKTEIRLKMRSGRSKPFLLIVLLLLIHFTAILFFHFLGWRPNPVRKPNPARRANSASRSNSATKRISKRARFRANSVISTLVVRSIPALPVMASCFGCHRVIAGSDEDPQKAIKNQNAIKKLLEYQSKARVNSLEKNP